MWAAIEEEEEEIQRVLQTFLFSVIMQRMHHAIMEVGQNLCNTLIGGQMTSTDECNVL